jgi:hypothetical protein
MAFGKAADYRHSGDPKAEIPRRVRNLAETIQLRKTSHSEVIGQFPVCRPTSKPICRDISEGPPASTDLPGSFDTPVAHIFYAMVFLSLAAAARKASDTSLDSLRSSYESSRCFTAVRILGSYRQEGTAFRTQDIAKCASRAGGLR